MSPRERAIENAIQVCRAEGLDVCVITRGPGPGQSNTQVYARDGEGFALHVIDEMTSMINIGLVEPEGTA